MIAFVSFVYFVHAECKSVIIITVIIIIIIIIVLLPLCRVFTNIYLKQTTFLMYTVLQLLCIYNLCYT